MEFTCAKCNIKLEKNTMLLRYGCPNCGSRVFKTSPSKNEESIQIKTALQDGDGLYTPNYGIIPKVDSHTDKRVKDLEEDHIPSIKLREKGVYQVNIDCLFRDKKSDPIILSSKSGIYRVELPNCKKEVIED
ncbi:MAG: hypothetical protein FK730_09070 [Asgard group archaeon]|nr:hypothetical protein [Asgard group archaeon]